MKKYRILALIHLILFLGAVVFILYNGTQSSTASNYRSDGISAFLKAFFDPKNRISERASKIIVRKAAHMAEYALLAFLASMSIFWARLCGIRVSIFAVLTTVMAFGLLDEFLQGLIDRTSAVTDVMIDTAGGLCGICAAAVCYGLLRGFLRRKRRKSL